MLNIGIIGYGYWGPNLVRNFLHLDDVKVHTVCDLNQEKINDLKKNYPSINFTSTAADIFLNKDISAVVIATPVSTHYSLAQAALKAGKHVLLEKPMTMNIKEAEELIEFSKKYNKVLMVDHTFLYTGAIKKMKEIINKNDIGKINYFDSTRINLGLFQPDINVLWDLAAHDISILLYLINEKPISINATGISHTKNHIENIAYITLNYNSDLIAHFNCSWSSPVKIRRTLIGGDKKMIVYNDMEPTEKIKIYDTGYSHNTHEEKQNILVDYRVSDISIPKLDTKEALLCMAEDFISAIKFGTSPISDYNIGLEVVKILEASQVSIKNKGKEVYI